VTKDEWKRELHGRLATKMEPAGSSGMTQVQFLNVAVDVAFDAIAEALAKIDDERRKFVG
jgi:hypothetical protein